MDFLDNLLSDNRDTLIIIMAVFLGSVAVAAAIWLVLVPAFPARFGLSAICLGIAGCALWLIQLILKSRE